MRSRQRKSQSFTSQKTVFLLAVVASLTICTSRVVAQKPESPTSQCRIGIEAPAYGFWTWPPNTEVKVFVMATHFTTEELLSLLAPLQSWNAVADTATSKVIFTYAGAVSEAPNCPNCLTIIRGKGPAHKANHAAQLYAYGDPLTLTITYAHIMVDPKIKDVRVLRNAMAHELGHNLGLLDCFSCRNRTSVMNVVNVSKGLEAPSVCDVAQVRRAYIALEEHHRTAVTRAARLVDEGEEPVEDDTPLIIPNEP